MSASFFDLQGCMVFRFPGLLVDGDAHSERSIATSESAPLRMIKIENPIGIGFYRPLSPREETTLACRLSEKGCGQIFCGIFVSQRHMRLHLFLLILNACRRKRQ